MNLLKHLAFHSTGRPRGWVRAILFKGRVPRPAFIRLVLDASGNPRPDFAVWIGSDDVAVVATQSVVLSISAIRPTDDVVVLVVYSPDGGLSRIHHHQLDSYAQAGCRIVLVVNSDVFPALSARPVCGADIIILRENRGFDFGGWRDATRLVTDLNRARMVMFTNDSILPVSVERLSRMRQSLVARPEDVVFLTESREMRRHGQSYFFCLKHAALASGALSVLRAIPDYRTKGDLILRVETRLSDQFAAQGQRVGVLFAPKTDARKPRNPTIRFWRELIAAGFPFLKIQLFEAGFLRPGDPEVVALLADDLGQALAGHLTQRARGKGEPLAGLIAKPTSS